MNSRVSWSVDGIDPSVRERAEAAARRAGMSLSDWLNSTIGEFSPARFPRAPYDQRPAMPSQESRDVADIHQRLDSITRQIEQISQPKPRSEMPRSENTARDMHRAATPRATTRRVAKAQRAIVARQLNDAISRLDARLSQISKPGPGASGADPGPRPGQQQRQAEAVERAAAQVYRPSPPSARRRSIRRSRKSPRARTNSTMPPPRQMPPRQRAADGPGRRRRCRLTLRRRRRSRRLRARIFPRSSAICSRSRARSRRCSAPTMIEQSIAAFRSELAEIRAAITEAMPRRAIELIENEIRSLSRRIDDTRQSGSDGQALAGIERALCRNPRSAALADPGRATRRL